MAHDPQQRNNAINSELLEHPNSFRNLNFFAIFSVIFFVVSSFLLYHLAKLLIPDFVELVVGVTSLLAFILAILAFLDSHGRVFFHNENTNNNQNTRNSSKLFWQIACAFSALVLEFLIIVTVIVSLSFSGQQEFEELPTPAQFPTPTQTLTPTITPIPSDTPVPSNTPMDIPVPSDTPSLTQNEPEVLEVIITTTPLSIVIEQVINIHNVSPTVPETGDCILTVDEALGANIRRFPTTDDFIGGTNNERLIAREHGYLLMATAQIFINGEKWFRVDIPRPSGWVSEKVVQILSYCNELPFIPYYLAMPISEPTIVATNPTTVILTSAYSIPILSMSVPSPTNTPTLVPSDTPTDRPTLVPSDTPTDRPTLVPSDTPTDKPTDLPSDTPTATVIPTIRPTTDVDITETTTETETSTSTETATSTATQTTTETETSTPTETVTSTATQTATETVTSIPTEMQTNMQSNMPVPVLNLDVCWVTNNLPNNDLKKDTIWGVSNLNPIDIHFNWVVYDNYGEIVDSGDNWVLALNSYELTTAFAKTLEISWDANGEPQKLSLDLNTNTDAKCD